MRMCVCVCACVCAGDIGCWNADGTVEFLGRIDSQVKFNGHRIELGEVEAALTKSTLIADAVVKLCRNVDVDVGGGSGGGGGGGDSGGGGGTGHRARPTRTHSGATATATASSLSTLLSSSPSLTAPREFLLAHVALADGVVVGGVANFEEDVPGSGGDGDAGTEQHCWLLSRALTNVLHQHCARFLEAYKIPTFIVCVGAEGAFLGVVMCAGADHPRCTTTSR